MLASLTSGGGDEPASKRTMRESIRTGAKKALLDWTKNAITRLVPDFLSAT